MLFMIQKTAVWCESCWKIIYWYLIFTHTINCYCICVIFVLYDNLIHSKNFCRYNVVKTNLNLLYFDQEINYYLFFLFFQAKRDKFDWNVSHKSITNKHKKSRRTKILKFISTYRPDFTKRKKKETWNMWYIQVAKDKSFSSSGFHYERKNT